MLWPCAGCALPKDFSAAAKRRWAGGGEERAAHGLGAGGVLFLRCGDEAEIRHAGVSLEGGGILLPRGIVRAGGGASLIMADLGVAGALLMGEGAVVRIMLLLQGLQLLGVVFERGLCAYALLACADALRLRVGAGGLVCGGDGLVGRIKALLHGGGLRLLLLKLLPECCALRELFLEGLVCGRDTRGHAILRHGAGVVTKLAPGGVCGGGVAFAGLIDLEDGGLAVFGHARQELRSWY